MLRLRYFILTLGLVFGATTAMLPTASHADSAKLRIGTEGTWKPFSYQDSAGQLIGFEVDLVRAACEKAEIACEFAIIPFENLIPALQENKIDAVASGIRASEKRKKVVDFATAYYIDYPAFSTCSHKDLKDYSAATLKGLSVAVQASTTGFDYLKARYPEVDIRAYKNVDDVWGEIASGRVDLAFIRKTSTSEFLQSDAGKACVTIGEVVTDPEYYSDPTAIAVRKGDAATKALLDKGIQAILSDGTFDRINAKYWPFSIKYKAP